MTTYAPTTTPLSHRIAGADVVLIARGLREEAVDEDPLAPAEQRIGTFTVDVDTVLAGELIAGEVRIRVLGSVGPDGVNWRIPTRNGPHVLLLQRETAPGAETYVAYESSAFPIRDDRIHVPDEILDEEARDVLRGAVTPDGLKALFERAQEQASRRDRMRSEREAGAPEDDAPVREAPGELTSPARNAEVGPIREDRPDAEL